MPAVIPGSVMKESGRLILQVFPNEGLEGSPLSPSPHFRGPRPLQVGETTPFKRRNLENKENQKGHH